MNYFIDGFFIAEEVTNHLAKVNGVVEILLKHATNDKLSNDVKQNAAICLAKLATSDERYGRNRNNCCNSSYGKVLSKN